MDNSTRSMYGWLTAFLLFLTTATYAQKSVKQMASEAKITVDLLAVQQQIVTTSANLPPELQGREREAQYMRSGNSIAIEAVVVDGQDGNTLLAQLQSLGLTEGLAEKRMVTGYLPVDKIGDLKTLSALRFARTSLKPIHGVGAVTSQGDRAMKADVAKQINNVTGSGSKIGILSDSYNALGGAQAGVASGDLPAGVQVIKDYMETGATDEGRGMAELVHDIAPGAAIAFNTANGGEPAFAKGIRDLAAAGCNIIVDDVSYLLAPFFQDGIVSQAVNEVVTTKNVSYFSAAANNARNSYQNAYVNTAFTGPYAYSGAHNFSGGDVYQTITVPARRSFYVIFQWDDPFASVSGGTGAKTDMDILVYRNGVFQGSLSGLDENINRDPVEYAYLSNNTTSPITYELVLAKYSGPAPSLVKWVAFTNGYDIAAEYETKSSTVYGHANAAGAITTGAAYYRDTPVYNNTLSTAIIEVFSSLGGTPILFNTAGQRITSVIRQKPEITAVDGGNTTFFGFDSDGDGLPNFFGTSAAAPHAAAVAALMQQRSGNQLTPNRVLAILEQTALDMDDELTAGFDAGYDPRTGYGFIQADKAVMMSNSAPTVANAIPPQSATVGQAYTYTIPSNTFTDAETPGSLVLSVSGLPPGLSFTTPATISGTPSTTIGSPFSVTIVATDPGSLAARTTFAFTIVPNSLTATAPVAPAIPNQTAMVGTAFSYVVPAFSGTMPITYSASGLPSGLSFDAANHLINGTPTMAQVSSVTVTGTNSTGSGSGIFTITVSASAVSTNFAITGVNTISCESVSSGQRRVTFTPTYSGLNGQPVTFQVRNETAPTTAAGPYTVLFYTDNPTVTLQAMQAGSPDMASFSYNWLSSCSSPTPTPPVAPAIPNQMATVGSFFSYVVPAFSGTMPITYSASGLPSGLSFDAGSRTVNGTPTMAQVSSVTVTGTNSTGSGSGIFTITVSASAVSTNFAITGVNTISCESVSAGQRRVTFTPTYSGLNGQPVTFQVRNETAPTTAAGPYTVLFYTDNPTVTLQAMQAGSPDMASFSYNWLSSCSSPTPTPPVAPAIPNQMATVGSFFSYAVPAFSGTMPITYSASGLPSGLSFDAANHLINGTPTMAQVSSVTVTGTNSAGSGSGIFTITVSASAVSTNFAITGVNTISCESVSAGQRRVTFTPTYSGLNGQPVTFQVRNETAPTTAAGPYTVLFYTDNPTVTLQAMQAGSPDMASFSYNWLSSCSSPTPTPPVAPAIPNQMATVGSFFSYVVPAFSGTMPITYSASGLPSGLSFDAANHLINGTPTMAQVSSVTVTGTNSAGSGSGIFTITVSASAVSTNFAITGVNTLSCVSVSSGQRQITFTPTYSGLNGQPVTFQVRNETAPTTAAGPYTVLFYTDNPTVMLQATQAGSADMASFSYNWLAACNSGARPMLESSEKLSVTVLGNPAVNEIVSVELRGANNQPVVVRSVDSQGRSIQNVTVEKAGVVERVDVKIGRSPGMYILHVSTPGQQEAVKLIKQ